MLRVLSFLVVGGLLAATASAAPSTCAGGKFLDKATGFCKPCNNSRVVKTCSSAWGCDKLRLTLLPHCGWPMRRERTMPHGKCDKCFLPTYKTCANGKSYSATSCTAQHCLGAGRCMPFAQIKSVSHCNKNGTIAPCPGQGASTCTVDGTTLSCNAPYFLNATVAAPPSKINNTVIVQRATAVNGTCVSSTGCGRAFYPDSKTRTCAPCGELVARCDETGALECESNYFFSGDKCVETCPDGEKGLDGACVDQSYCPSGIYEPFTRTCRESCYATTSEADGLFIPAEYPSADGKTCIPCKSENAYQCDQATGSALSCIGGYYFLDGKCYSTCPEGYKIDGGLCIDKTICPSGQFYESYSETCVLSCPATAHTDGGVAIPAQYGDVDTKTCVACRDAQAAQCNQETGLAVSCNSGFFLSDDKCVNPCPEGKKGLNGVCVDQSYCPTGLYEPFTKTCVDACYSTISQVDRLAVPAEYPSADGKTCLACKSENALECDQATGLAVSCINGYFLLDGQCYNPFPEGWTGKEGKCVKDEPTPTTPTPTAPAPVDTCLNAPIWTDESNCVPTQAVNPPGKYQGSLSWNYKGCYKSSLKNRQGMPLALQAFYGQTQITQEECLTLAESKGMPVAALRNGNQCLGGFALPSDAIPSAAEECSVAGFGGACLGDPSTDCGGRESMDVYVRQCAPLRTGPSNACLDGYLGFKYDGCHVGDLYATYGNSAQLQLSQFNMTLDGCLRACKAKPGVKYCSMAEGWICHGSPTLNAVPANPTLAKYAPIAESYCSVPCFDNQAQHCGGPRFNPSLFGKVNFTTVFSSYYLPDQ